MFKAADKLIPIGKTDPCFEESEFNLKVVWHKSFTFEAQNDKKIIFEIAIK